MVSQRGIRKKRTEQLLRPAGHAYFVDNQVISGFVQSARLLLNAAYNERQPRDGQNFLTTYGPSAILVAATAFECFLNDVLLECLFILHDPLNEFEQLARSDTLMEKFQKVPALVTGSPGPTNVDLELVQHVRNELVHYYPRSVGNVPEWLEPLVEKNVLYSIGGAKDGTRSLNRINWRGGVPRLSRRPRNSLRTR